MIEELILVDHEDQPIGKAEKLLAHQQGLLHRAFSIFLLRPCEKGVEVLLQQRALSKYHSAGLWSNTCCGHPRPHETILAAAQRRLVEEMAIQASLQEIGTYSYKALLKEGLWENEITHIFIGWHQGQAFSPNPCEVMNYQWAHSASVETWLANAPNELTVWFQGVWNVFIHNYKNNNR